MNKKLRNYQNKLSFIINFEILTKNLKWEITTVINNSRR